jgi:general secretion pathway protein L
MKKTTIIRINKKSPDHSEWVTIDSYGKQISEIESGNLNDISEEDKTNTLIVLTPATDSLLTFIDLPIKSNSKLKKAIPYALEDQIASDIKDIHFGFVKPKKGKLIGVAAISKSELNDYKNLLLTHNIQPHVITSEIHGVPIIEKTITLLIESSRVYINNGLNKAYALDGMDIMESVNLIDTEKNITNVQIYLSENNQDLIAQSEKLRDSYNTVDVKILAKGLLQKLSHNILNANYINFLQGEHAPKIHIKKYFKPWRYATLLVIIFFALSLINKSVNYIQLSKYEKNLASRFLNEYRYFAINATDISDPIRIISAIKNNDPQIRENSLFFEGLDIISNAIKNKDNVLLNSITFQGNIFNIRLFTPNIALLDAIARGINQNNNYAARIQSTNQENDTVESRIEIQVLNQ